MNSLSKSNKTIISWLVAALLLTALSLFFLDTIALANLRSYDGLWHLTCGRLIVESGEIPNADPICFTTEGKHWVNLNWLAQIVLYKSFQGFGFAGPLTVATVLFALSMIFVAFQLKRGQCSPIVFIPALILASYGIYLGYTIRPQAWSFMLVPLFALILFNRDFENDLSIKKALLLLGLMLFWNQVHGGFVYGYAILGMDALGTTLDSRIHRGYWINRRAVILNGIIVIGLASFALHPHGYDAFLHALNYTKILEYQYDSIGELMPFSFQETVGTVLEIFLLSSAVVLYFSRRTIYLRELLILVLFLHVTLDVYRAITPFFILSGPMIALHWTSVIERVKEEFQYGYWFGYLEEALKKSCDLVLPVLIGFSVFWPVVAMPLRAGPEKPGQLGKLLEHRDVAIFSLLYWEANQVPGRIYNNYNIGGYLDWIHYTDRRVMIDGRGDIHGAFYRSYLKYNNLKGDWREFLDRERIEILFHEKHSPITKELKKRGWTVHYTDPRWTILLRPKSGKEALPKK